MAAKKSVRDKLSEALMEIIARDGWPLATLDKVAAHADVSPADMAGDIANRFDLLDHFGRSANVRALKIAEEEGGSQAVRDKLFAVIMARFDVLQPVKPAIIALRAAARRDPGLALYFARSVPKYLALLLETSGVSTVAGRGRLRAAGFTALYLQVVQAWLDDTTPDQAKTMAALDKMLARAETWGQRMSEGRVMESFRVPDGWKFWQRRPSEADFKDVTPAPDAT